MATKVELEAALNRCVEAYETARKAAAAHDYAAAVKAAEASLPDAWQAVAFLRRFREVEKPGLPGVELLLKYAPVVFAWRALDAVEAWFNDANRKDKKAYAHLTADLAAARQALAEAARLWDELDSPLGCPVSRASSPAAVAALDAWVAMGAVRVQGPAGFGAGRHVSHPTGRFEARCGSCGESHRASLSDFLNPVTCPGCRRASEFVLARRVV
jgi:hypothetical protein